MALLLGLLTEKDGKMIGMIRIVSVKKEEDCPIRRRQRIGLQGGIKILNVNRFHNFLFSV